MIAPVLLSVFCATAQADFFVKQVGPVEFGNSWTVPVSVFNPNQYDLFVMEVVGETFEPTPLAPPIATAPGTWSGTWVSSQMVYAEGPAFGGIVGLDLTFDGVAPPTTFGSVTVNFSAFTPGSENASSSGALIWDGHAFVFSTGSLTSITRSAVAQAPVPGAVFLGLMGFGLVGLARKRLN